MPGSTPPQTKPTIVTMRAFFLMDSMSAEGEKLVMVGPFRVGRRACRSGSVSRRGSGPLGAVPEHNPEKVLSPWGGVPMDA
ncbi:hypothetical protein GCM10009793_18460 [Brachybacterium phenoliresistens]